MSIECRYSQSPRSSGAQCIYKLIGLIDSNYAVMTKIAAYAHPSKINKNSHSPVGAVCNCTE